MEQLAARWAHNPKVASSSLAPATNDLVVFNSLYQWMQAILFAKIANRDEAFWQFIAILPRPR